MAFDVSRLGRYELRRFRGGIAKASIVFVILIPLLYNLIYLSANWDPYGKVKDLPVAVVNTDQTVTVDGKPTNVGDDLVANLIAGHAFAWQQTDAATADRGLADGDYYLVLTIPADFTADLVSGSGADPERAHLEMRRDDANGYVVGNLTKAAQNSIVLSIDQAAQESYFNAVFANLAQIRTGLSDGADGAKQLADGTADAYAGSTRLASGSKDLMAGAKQLSSGAGALASGLDSADTGAASLSAGLGRLDDGSATLADGAEQVADGTQKLDDAVVPTLSTVEKALPRIEQRAEAASSSIDDATQARADLKRRHPELADDPAFSRLSRQLDTVADRSDDIRDELDRAPELGDRVKQAKADVQRLNRGAHSVADGADDLHAGIGRAAAGASTLAAGVHSAADGADQLAGGADQLYDGTVTLHDGATRLSAGLDRLSDGSKRLATELSKGAKRIPVVSADQQADAVEVLSAPAQVDAVVDNPATFNGRGFAPLFLAVALWVLGISVFQVMRPINNRLLTGRANPLRLALAAWMPVAAVAVIAGWLMVGAVWLFLDLDPVHPVLIMATVTLGALCFSAIAHLLNVALGSVGSSLLLMLLLLQLSASGGTYPGYLLPPFFDAIGPFLPLTYLIDAYRYCISGGLTSHFVRDLGILAAVLVVIVGLIVVVVRRRQSLTFAKLHPAGAAV